MDSDEINGSYSDRIKLNTKSSGRQALSQDMFEDQSSGEILLEEEKVYPASSNMSEKKLNLLSVPNPPAVAVQEKIVFCIDNSLDKGIGYTFKKPLPNNLEANTTSIRNEALKTLITNKLLIAKDTEFGITVLEAGDVKWLLPLTSSTQKFMESLADLKPVANDEEPTSCDVTNAFRSVLSQIEVPHLTNKVTVMPPPYLIRLIFVYGNSVICPKVNVSDSFYVKFMMSPYCVLDVIYLHEKQSDFNNVEQIYEGFGEIMSSKSYLLESSRSLTKVFNNMAKLLAHPFQRVQQDQWSF